MDTRQKIIVVVAVAVVLAGIIGYGWWSGSFNRFLPYQGQKGTEKTIQTPEGELKGVEVAPGTSLITEEGDVVLNNGEKANNSSDPGKPSAPQQSNPVTEKEIPPTVIKINASMADGFTPKTFSVFAGAPVSISVTSQDKGTYVFKFRDVSLKGVAIGVGPGDPTRVISFTAPVAKGEYSFYAEPPILSNLPAFQGKMTVR